jgi:hypothetical protein
MLPGYRKKTKFVPTVRDSTGFATINSVVDAIKDMTSAEEFYEIEPAEVLKVFLDASDSQFPTLTTKTGKKIPDLSLLGAVQVRLLHSQDRNESLNKLVKPISQHIVQYPLKGEVVNVAQYNGELYYYNPLNLYGNVNMNRLPFAKGEGKVYPALTKYNRKINVEEGDTVIQGRFGQSIHLGSDENFVKPFIKLTAGQSQDKSSLTIKQALKGMPHLSEINLDESSIWVTTNGHVPLKTAAASAMKPAHLGGKLSSVIAMNSDSIALNAKGLGNTDKKPYSPGGDIHAYAARNINLAAKTSINLETAYGTIHLGAGLGIADNPMVKGKELNDFLTTLIDKMVDYVETTSGAKTRTDIVNASNEFTGSMLKLKEKLGASADFFSKKVYVVNDHNPPDVSEPAINNRVSSDGDDSDLDFDIEFLWDNTVWEDVSDVIDEGYEVEGITATAGVRG